MIIPGAPGIPVEDCLLDASEQDVAVATPASPPPPTADDNDYPAGTGGRAAALGI
jgi:hypothetical protein